METYVVRIWLPADSEAWPHPPLLRGEVEHSASGASTTFIGADQLFAFLNRAHTPPTHRSAAPDLEG